MAKETAHNSNRKSATMGFENQPMSQARKSTKDSQHDSAGKKAGDPFNDYESQMMTMSKLSDKKSSRQASS